jgi:Uma2 family endonuclease
MSVSLRLPDQDRSGSEIEYPDCDGEPMADNTLQYEWIVTIKGGLDAVFRDDPNVFVAGNLLWYPVKGDNLTRIAPDALVAFGRPKGNRGSYKQWEEGGIPPQVVFEVLSPNNHAPEMERKLGFYERFGVDEYYQYDPDHVVLRAWKRDRAKLAEIPSVQGWVSRRLGVRFDMSGEELRIIGPDGRPFATFDDVCRQRDEAERARNEAERERTAEHSRAERLAERLRALGFDPDA